MRTIRALLLVAASTTLAGCINSATLITVKPDGSGTVEQSTLVNIGGMKAMMPGMTQPGQSGNPVNEADLKRAAERMGKGVRLVSAEPAKAGGFEGVKAVFAFDDINQLQVSQDPSMSGSTTGVFASAPPPVENPVKFSLKRDGGTSVLTVQFQDKPAGATTPSDTPQGGPDMTDPMVLNMVKTMFDGFKIGIDLQVVGTIVKTNAEYVNGSRLTLLEMDLGQLFQDQEKLKALQGKVGPGASLSEVKPYLKDVKGIKIDGPTVTVEFR
ncbi:MAG: hypothetical protein IT180_15475 [Acidobacteria bacterium]|nr:hypothetical protein [Acidobacteriota bacterium]HQZ40197.1 hypothetical protein [Vicinamibacterales bacterium]